MPCVYLPGPAPAVTVANNRAGVTRNRSHQTQGTPHRLVSINMSKMELTTVQCSHQKMLDEIRRIRGALGRKESPTCN